MRDAYKISVFASDDCEHLQFHLVSFGRSKTQLLWAALCLAKGGLSPDQRPLGDGRCSPERRSRDVTRHIVTAAVGKSLDCVLDITNGATRTTPPSQPAAVTRHAEMPQS